MFQINDRVKRKGNDPRVGTVVQIEEWDSWTNTLKKATRCRVLWDAIPGGSPNSNYHRAKHTWVDQRYLLKVEDKTNA